MFESIKLQINTAFERESLISLFAKYGYVRRDGISEEGDFSVKGETVIVYPATFEYPVRIEFDGDIITRITSVDVMSFKAIEDHQTVIILPCDKGRHFKKRVWGTDDPIDAFVDIRPGDYVVHVDYGIGKYLGIREIKGKKGREECCAIEYRDGDVLYVPVSDMNKVQKYIFFRERKPELYKLGGKSWQAVKARVARGVYKMAHDILDIQAKRESMKGFRFSQDTEWQVKVEALFPHKDTPDQVRACADVKKDMESERPMDRLLCGDVGYGKTEVALRAAFKAVMDNKQVAILVPTTILAEQHFNTFRVRFKDFPVRVEMLSRFRTRSDQERIVLDLAEGKVDVIIGTHRLISGDISFKDLGLVIIDEEQRFGVRHKEKLKKMRFTVDVLTLTATPIPRTLYLALMGGRDISVINTPPLERHPVDIKVIEYDEREIKAAIEHELKRDGQVFFVHNRVDNIDKVAGRIKRLFPSARLAIGHGQMTEKDLERTMISFIKGEVDVLVCTTIIESGIDIPNANTLIVNNAERFGLAELYQLKGRVGRFTRKAYAYFVVNRMTILTHDEQKRFEALRRFSGMGSGFKVAMQDLELRGAGNLLGVEQHGYMEQVGFDLYCRLLKKAVQDLKG